ncbi:TolB family protein [Fodinibius roseus]|nr:DPP IV N-terminal domain-containing protein [Fodinibius roseus]
MKQAVFISLLLAFISCGVMGSGDDRPDIPGKIVFSAKDGEGTSQIYTMNADGSDLEQLTHFGPEGGATDPAWSPDGKLIVFENYTGATTLGPYLYVMDSDGTNMRPLKKRQRESISALIGSAPAWSPDGTNIAYQVCTNCELGGRDYEIVVVEVAGKDYDPDQIHAITDHPASDMKPTWSPDGQRIAFVSDRDYVDADTLRFRKDLYVVDTDGSNQRRMTETGFARDPVWNPDSNTIGFRSSSSSLGLFLVSVQSGVIFKVEEDFSTSIQLFPVAWCPDGQKLLITARDQSEPRDYSLYIIDTEKNETILIPFGPTNIGDADWIVRTTK